MFTHFHKRIRQFYIKRRLQSIARSRTHVARRVYLINLFNLLEGEDLKIIPPHVLQEATFSSLHPNVESMIQHITELNRLTSNRFPISSDLLLNPIETMSFDKFFTNKRNCYADVSEAYKALKQQCLKLFTYLEPMDDAEYGYYEACGRLLTPTFTSIETFLINIIALYVEC